MFGVSLVEILSLVVFLGIVIAVVFVVKIAKKTKPLERREGTKFCSQCGTEIDVNLEKCSNCGLMQAYFGGSEQEGNNFIYRRVIAVIEIIGSVVGVITTLNTMISSGIYGLFFSVIMLGAYIYVGFAGWWLWKGYVKGYKASLIVQAAQIPVFVSPIITYQFVAGATLRLLAGTGGAGFYFHLGSMWDLNLLHDAGISIGINVVAIAGYIIIKKITPAAT